MGVSLSRVAELCQGHVDEKELHAIAREVVTQSSAPDADLGLLVLTRSNSAARDTDFIGKHVTNLTSEAPEELLYPLFFNLMQEPVVLSSGYVVDKSTALDEHGRLKFTMCPFTRALLKPDVYPLVDRRRKLQEFKEKRLEAMTSTAEALMAERKFAEFDQVIEAAERFLDDLGDKTYFHRARELAEMRLRGAALPGRSVPPAGLAKIYVRIYRALSSDELHHFGQRVAPLEQGARQALAAGRADEVDDWCNACEEVQRACKVLFPVARLRLEVAKLRGQDLKVLRQIAWREVCRCNDPEAIQRFFEQEGIGPEDVRDLRPVLLYRAWLVDDTEDDEWHAMQRSMPLEGAVAKVRVTVSRFEDQGWGNTKGRLGLALYDAGGAFVARCNLFGTYRSEGYGYGRSPSRDLDETEEVVARAQPGFSYSVEYTVGGGGGHSLSVRSLFCKIFPVGWIAPGMASCRMADPEGDEGLYTGPADGDGKPHGFGELEYDDGELFVGLFDHGTMVEGAHRHGEREVSTMSSGRWTANVDPELLEKYPQNVIVIGDSDWEADEVARSPDGSETSQSEVMSSTDEDGEDAPMDE